MVLPQEQVDTEPYFISKETDEFAPSYELEREESPPSNSDGTDFMATILGTMHSKGGEGVKPKRTTATQSRHYAQPSLTTAGSKKIDPSEYFTVMPRKEMSAVPIRR